MPRKIDDNKEKNKCLDNFDANSQSEKFLNEEKNTNSKQKNEKEKSKIEKSSKKRKLKSGEIATILISVILLVSFSVFLPFYLKSLDDEKGLFEANRIRFAENGTVVAEKNFEEMQGLVESEQFEAIYDTSTTDPVANQYIGFELKPLLESLGINLDGKTSVTLKGSDGHSVVYSIGDVLLENNVFIAFKVNGKVFKKGIAPIITDSSQEDGGPYVGIKVNDKTSQKRMRMLVEINVR